MQTPTAAALTPSRHPFRRSLGIVQAVDAERREEHDLKLFVLSFTAFFICIYSFIS
ncbi:hypothetical protein ACFO8O_07155 [Hephaestia sp. GCM10023244]|uniref:hypothetical protein n=1 Tax=unclassified Hephaestia TaxID=2631281 RepID=UPI0020777115|nr:hypothetical protein [Hephaestia sp. MAHUQ-44]MCM8730745.1 hypothetical protein [Hephaestia sp. MAHUQ-44]